MSLNTSKCAIPSYYCGTNTVIPKRKKTDEIYYVRHGTPYECLKKGYGAGMITEKNKNLPKDSLQQIKYVGEKYENTFKKQNIKNIKSLILHIKDHNHTSNEKLLKSIFVKKGGIVDKRAYNSTILFLYNGGANPKILPECDKITKL
jgi:hypothetical protein